MKIAIKNATIINPDNTLVGDILIEDNKIISVGKKIVEKVDKEIEAKGKHVLPGFIDMHVHLRTPGREDEEDLASGSYAAAKGGFIKVFCMPNTEPAIDEESVVHWIQGETKKIDLIDIYPVGAITKGREGKMLTEFGALQRAGCLSLSDDGCSVNDSLLLRRALEYAKKFGLLLISHCEDKSLANDGAMRESFIAARYGISSIPSISESAIVARDIELARYLDTKMHIAHVSTKRSVELIRQAKKEGVKITAETCPHYITLTVEDIEKSGFNSNFKVNPPIGEKSDLEAIRAGLKDGTIDCLATDHAPHSQAEKELPFENAPFGMIGLEWAFSINYMQLVKTGVLSLNELAYKMSYAPAKIMGWNHSGKIAENYLADIAIIDLEKRWKINEHTIVSKSKNTPFLGWEVEAAVEYTIHNGRVVYKK